VSTIRYERARSILTPPFFALHLARIKESIDKTTKRMKQNTRTLHSLPSLYPSFDRYAFIATQAQIQRSIDGMKQQAKIPNRIIKNKNKNDYEQHEQIRKTHQ
jgi:hypothetical protein